MKKEFMKLYKSKRSFSKSDFSTYVNYLNSFTRWCKDISPTKHNEYVIMLYTGLLNTFGRQGWKTWISIKKDHLMLLVNATDPKDAYRARDTLVEAGFLDYKLGKKGKLPTYRLLKYDSNSATENEIEMRSTIERD